MNSVILNNVAAFLTMYLNPWLLYVVQFNFQFYQFYISSSRCLNSLRFFRQVISHFLHLLQWLYMYFGCQLSYCIVYKKCIY